MANLKLEIIVDDKGGVKVLRQFGDEAKKAGTDSQKAFSGASDSIQRNWLAMTAAVGAAMLGVHKTIELLGHGAKEKQIEEAFHNVARSYGQDADKIVDAMYRATAGTINSSDLMQKAIKGMTQDLSGADMVKVAEMARVAARTTGEDVSAMFDQISDAIANQTPRALRRLGLVSKEELKVLEGAVAAGVEGVNLLDLAFIQATKSGEAMGGMAKNESEYFQQLKAVGKEMYDTLSQGALSYATALSKLGQGDMALAGLSPAGMGVGRQSDPKAYEQSASAEQRKKAILDKIKADTKAAKDREEAIKNAPKLAAERKKAAEDEAAVYQEMFEGAKEAYTYTFKMAAEAAKAEDDRIKQTLAGIESAEKAEQEKSEMLGQMAMVDQKIAEGTAKDKADADRQMYEDIGKTTESSYKYKSNLLDEEYKKYKRVLGDSEELNNAYNQRKKKLDQELALSSNKFFKGIEVGYERMLDDQMTWAKGGLAIFNTFAKSGQSTISNVLFDGIKGDLKSFSDYWDNFFDSLLRTFTDTVAEMATQKLADAAVKPLVNFVGGAASAAGGAAWDWLSGIEWFHSGAYVVGDALADRKGNLSSDEVMAILQKGEMVIPKDVAEQVRMMIGGGTGGSTDPFGGISAGAIAGVIGGSEIGGRMGSAYGGVAVSAGINSILGMLSGMDAEDAILGSIGPMSLTGPAFKGIMEAIQESYGMETGSGRYSTTAAVIGTAVAALTQNAMLGLLANLGIAGYGNYSYTKEKAAILGLNPDIAAGLAAAVSAAAQGMADAEANSAAGSIGGGFGDPPAGDDFDIGGIARGPRSGYRVNLHGTEAVVPLPNGRSIPVEMKSGGGDLPPVQINLVLDGKTLAKVLYKQTRAGVKTIHDRGLTNV